MNADGTDFHRLTHDDCYDVDPDGHPDGESVAFSSYQGDGTPSRRAQVRRPRHQDFHLARA